MVLRPDVLREAFQIAQFVVLQPRAVHQASVAVIPDFHLTRAIRQIVVWLHPTEKIPPLNAAGLKIQTDIYGSNILSFLMVRKNEPLPLLTTSK